MNTSKRGNKEAKKPKKQRDATPPPAPAGATTQGAMAVAALRKKKW